MIKSVAILGSTGSIGKTLLQVLKKEKNFKILLLSADKSHNELLKQAIKFKVKNIIITNLNSYKILKEKKLNINIYNNFKSFKKIFKSKIDYTMSAITGLNGLFPTLNIIKHSRNIAIANKESIICGWNLINKEMIKYNVKFVPVDSEHFSVWYGLKENLSKIDKIYLTASGGPFLNFSKNKLENVNIKQALNHPNWKMGKKISIDSATMMNKVFEIIEAKNIFKINYNQLSILTHPASYVHAIIKFSDGLIKIIAHDTTMKIPISNSINFNNGNNFFKRKKINIEKLNNLNLKLIDTNKFPTVKILKLLPSKISLFETILVSANDELVKMFLNNEIKYDEITTILSRIVKKKEFIKYKTYVPKNINEILSLSEFVRLKIKSKSI